jgi:4-hydroxybenzoate polyprenyltransferase
MNTVIEFLRAMRVYQWVKNLLVFVPMVAAHNTTREAALSAVAAFFCFGLCASAAYLVNDLKDLEADRAHPRKKDRPFASGRLPEAVGMPTAALLTAAGLGGAAMLSLEFAAWLVVYIAVTLGYSMLLKRLAMMDVLVLAGLYTVRVIGGGAATGDRMTIWLLAFSMFLFTSLACLKRYGEVDALAAQNKLEAGGRGYRAGDEALLLSFGSAAGMAAVITLALYLNSDVVAKIYMRPHILWAVCPVMLYWVGRMWLAARRGRMTDDPIVFAVRDPISWALLAAIAVIVVAAWFG